MFEPTHLDKMYWPEAGYTKGDMLKYYERISPYLLPYLKDRPVVLKRFPHGISGQSFFQKNVEGDVPKFVKRVTIPAETIEKDVHYIVCNNVETLSYLANLGTIELHPWNSRVKKLHHPDFMIFDLDPGEGTTYNDVVAAALQTRELLDELGVSSYPKTSGKKGIHLYVPLGAKYSYDEVRDFAHRVSGTLATRYPKLLTAKRGEEHRHKKIFVDYLRNSVGQTAVAPYSLRASPEATVSTPLNWSEVKKGLNPKLFTIESVLKRLKVKGDLWEPVLSTGVEMKAAAKQLRALASK
ncbi:MAG: DNA ligase (ATP) [Parcubacteria group bacterium Gr01-1014_8]|nr:MAG: DNA ligase (ATP) [Parcubacteria group bacterium Gr01-1014_8]